MGKTQEEEERYYISPGTGLEDIPVWLAVFLTVCIHTESQTSEQLGQDDDRNLHLLKLFPEQQTTAQLLAHFHKPTQQGNSLSTDS
jgi:hypothetical protein